MHWHRLVLTGPGPAVTAAMAHLVRAGASVVPDQSPPCVVWRTRSGIDDVEAVSRRHPQVALGTETFEEFCDQLLRGIVVGGDLTVMDRGGVLPSGWGSSHDEEGVPLDPVLLGRAGDLIRRANAEVDGYTLSDGLASAVAVCGELGTLAAAAGDYFADDAPTPQTLEAVIRLAVLAVHISCVGRSMHAAECAYEHAFTLTQAVVHAGVSEYSEIPGRADWMSWLGVLLSSASGIIEAASYCTYEPEQEWHAQLGEHHQTPTERLEAEARSTLTTCIELLTLFAPGASVA